MNYRKPGCWGTRPKGSMVLLASIWLTTIGTVQSNELEIELPIQRIENDSPRNNPTFGGVFSVEGDQMLLGSPNDRAVLYYQRDESGVWQEKQPIVLDSSGDIYLDVYLDSISIGESAAADRVVMSTHSFRSGTPSVAASIIYERDETGIWQEVFRLDEVTGRVVMSGSMVAISQPGGEILFLERDSENTGEWSVSHTLDTGLQYISSIDMDGDYILVGSTDDRAIMFQRNGEDYIETPLLPAQDVSGDYVGYGASVTIGGSGDFAMVGAPGFGELSGAVFVFRRNPTGDWVEADSPLRAYNFKPGDNFGSSLDATSYQVIVGSGSRSFEYGLEVGGATLFATDPDGDKNHWDIVGRRNDSVPYRVAERIGLNVVVDGDFTYASRNGGVYVYNGFPTDPDSDPKCDVSNFNLPDGQWHQISLPCDPGNNNTVADIFGDDGLGVFGTDWGLWADSNGSYDMVELTTELKTGTGYWIIQMSGSTQTLDMPDNSTVTPVTESSGCPAAGCVETALATLSDDTQWNLVGYPFATAQPLANVRVQTHSGVCSGGCDLDTTMTQNLVSNEVWAYDGTDFVKVSSSDHMEPWTAYWIKVLKDADGLDPVMLMPLP